MCFYLHARGSDMQPPLLAWCNAVCILPYWLSRKCMTTLYKTMLSCWCISQSCDEPWPCNAGRYKGTIHHQAHKQIACPKALWVEVLPLLLIHNDSMNNLMTYTLVGSSASIRPWVQLTSSLHTGCNGSSWYLTHIVAIARMQLKLMKTLHLTRLPSAAWSYDVLGTTCVRIMNTFVMDSAGIYSVADHSKLYHQCDTAAQFCTNRTPTTRNISKVTLSNSKTKKNTEKQFLQCWHQSICISRSDHAGPDRCICDGKARHISEDGVRAG